MGIAQRAPNLDEKMFRLYFFGVYLLYTMLFFFLSGTLFLVRYPSIYIRHFPTFLFIINPVILVLCFRYNFCL